MKNIVSIKHDKVGLLQGCECDRCGLWITEIITVVYLDATKKRFGTTCFNKLWLSEKLWTQLEKK